MRVLVAMSGGVDSAVAAARLVAQGHDVTGVHLALDRNPATYRSGSRGCCSLSDSHDARRVADKLGIPFYIWDFADQFHAEVVEDFVSEYRLGRTPNPCMRCNEKIKFAAVLSRGTALGFDAVATGHYARLKENNGQIELWRAEDPNKDQSYVLGMLNQTQLAKCLFPLNDVHKSRVREEATALGFGVAKKPDSYDICFIPDGDTAGYLSRELGARSGNFVDLAGNVVGEHNGAHQFTIGQRKGLHLGTPAADGRPRYVLEISPSDNTVKVGSKADLAVKSISGVRVTWTQEPCVEPWVGLAQIRAHGAALPARICGDGDGIAIGFNEPVLGVAPGQTVVLYDGDRVVGSATISATRRDL